MELETFRKLTNGHFFSAVFTKKDGTLRKINGHPKVTKYIKGTGNTVTDGRAVILDRLVLRDNLKAGMNRFDAGSRAYRSIWPNTIKELRVGGKVYDGEGREVYALGN